MDIWLDDERQVPEGYLGAKTVDDAIALVERAKSQGEKIDVISLDHDLGTDLTGHDFVCWIERSIYDGAIDPPNEIKVHSANPVGARRMRMAIDRIYARLAK